MSTRSIIAKETENGWGGRYHHWDGYPAGVGATLYTAYNGHFEKDIEKMLKFLIDDHPAGWSTIVHADFSKEPGFNIGLDDEGPPAPQCYCHGSRSEEGWLHASGDDNFGGAEFCYVLDNHEMTVLVRVYEDGTAAVQFFGVDASDVAKGVHWETLAVVNLDGPEPDWDKM